MSNGAIHEDPERLEGYNGDSYHGREDNKERRPRPRAYRAWIENNMTWSWFTCTQSTGGIAVTLSECPKQFHGLQTLGTIIFIFNVVMWLIFVSLMLTRWISEPSSIKRCFTQAPECYFFGSFWVSIATFIICMQRFGEPHTGDWLLVAIRVLYWIYIASTLLNTTVHLCVIFQHTPIVAIEMNPAWFLLIFNAMLTGTVAAAIAESQPPAQRMPIIVAGVAWQGLGWIASILFLAWFVGHLMEKGWPPPPQRPGLFMTVGSAGFTIVALIGAARAAPDGYGYFASHPMAHEILQVVATWVGVFLWGFTLWLFGLALVVCLAEVVTRKDGRWVMPMNYTNTWWAFIFPNVGFTLATIYLGQELESNAILWVSVAMVLLLVTFWLLDLCLMAKAIITSLFIDSRIKFT